LPLPWFRRKPNDPAAPPEAVAPASPVVIETEPVAPAPELDGAETEAQKRKRRRGSRGGKGRKKPGTAAAANGDAADTEKPAKPEKPAAKPAAEKKTPERKPERKSSSRSSSGSRSSTRRRQPPKRAPLPAAKRELLVSVDVGEQRVAILEDDRVAEVYLERPDKRSIAGNIYLGTVDNVLPGMEAAFVEIGLEKNGFLYVDEIVRPELEGKRHGMKIQDLIQRGQTVLVQAVKDPMKTKGARLTMEISLPGRFVVFVPEGEGLGVSRRLPDDERARLKDVIKGLNVKTGGVIVRTAAEGASAEDVERDLVFLQRLWKTIQTQAKNAKAPALIYQEAELPLRVTRDLFTGDFERALVDNDTAYKRIVGYLKKTSPHMVERVHRYKDKGPLFEATGVDAEIRSTLNRRVDLPSGGYLIFDYAEAFTVVDVNTGRFVGSRSKSSGARLEDTITKNNLEAVKEVVRQLRLRDIGGIIVIDFIDMANPSNRAAVEEALRTELERDRTKTYVVEISPLGLVEMTRQNVTDGPREILTKKCPTCGGDGIVYSEASAAIDVERRLKALAAGSRVQAFQIELNPKVAALVIGRGAERLVELEEQTKKRFFVVTKDGVHTDHLAVLAEGSIAKLAPSTPVEQDAEVELKLVEVDKHDPGAAVGKIGDLDVVVADAAKLVGKKVKAKVVRVLDGVAYALQAGATSKDGGPITAEAEAEKPTRKPPVRKGAAAVEVDEPEEPEELEELEVGELEELEAGEAEPEPVAEAEAESDEEVEEPADGEATAVKKKTRRGSRGGRNRKKKPTIHVPGADIGRDGERAEEAPAAADTVAEEEPVVAAVAEESVVEAAAANGEPAAAPKKKTRRGSRGGKNRRKRVVREGEVVSANGESPNGEASLAEIEAPAPEAVVPAATGEEPTRTADKPSEYVPMSEWLDDFE
jgi:ribonuclease G